MHGPDDDGLPALLDGEGVAAISSPTRNVTPVVMQCRKTTWVERKQKSYFSIKTNCWVGDDWMLMLKTWAGVYIILYQEK